MSKPAPKVFPDWAPACLIQRHHSLRDTINRLEEISAVIPGYGRTSYQAALEENTDGILRLVTRPEMKSVWKGLLKPTRPEYADTDVIAGEIGIFIEQAMIDFHDQINGCKSAKDHRKALIDIASNARELQHAIRDNQTANHRAENLILKSIVARRVRRQKDESNYPPSEANLFEEFLKDAIASLDEIGGATHELGDNACWRKRPLTTRLARWIIEISDISVEDLLDCLANEVEHAANQPPEIKRPKYGDRAKTPFLARRLYKQMQSMFGKPHTQHIATILTVFLNLSRPLESGDIDEYWRHR